MAVLQYIPDADDPYGVVRRLLGALPSGSHLVMSHPASDITAAEVAESIRVYNERAAAHAAATPRTPVPDSVYGHGAPKTRRTPAPGIP